MTAAASWVAFGLRPETSIAAAAGGITVAFLAQIAAVKLRDLLRASRRIADELGEALTAAQQQMEVRLNAWTDDLERAQRGVGDQLAQLAQRQKQLISE